MIKMRTRVYRCIYNILSNIYFALTVKEPKLIYWWAIKQETMYWFNLGYFKELNEQNGL